MQGFALLINKFSIYSLVLQKSLSGKWACFPPNQDVYFFQIAENSRIQTITLFCQQEYFIEGIQRYIRLIDYLTSLFYQ